MKTRLAALTTLALLSAAACAASAAPVGSARLADLDGRPVGTVSFETRADGRVVLHLSGAKRVAAPGVRVLLSAFSGQIKARDTAAIRTAYLDLGEVKAADGAFVLPRGTRLNAFSTVVVWCTGAGLPIGGGKLGLAAAGRR